MTRFQLKTFLFSLVLMLLSLCCFSQFNDSVTHFLRLSASGNLNRSNSTSAYLLSNEARFSIKNKRTTLNTAANWFYGEQGNNLTNNDFITTADLNFYIDSSNLYYWALANYTTSYSLKINSQGQAGVGAAYNFLNKPNAWLNLSEGILYEASRLNTGEPANDKYETFRNSLRLSYKFTIKNLVTFSGTNYIQNALGKENDYILRTGNTIGIKLNKWISFNTAVTYNQFPRTGTENLLFTYGLVVEGYF